MLFSKSYERAVTTLLRALLPVSAPAVVLTILPTSWPSVASTGFRSREFSVSLIISTRFSSLASSRTCALTFAIRRNTRSMDTSTPALNCSSCSTCAAKLIFAVRFDTVRSISPTWTVAFRKTSGSGTVGEPLVWVEEVSYTVEPGLPDMERE